MKAAYLLIAALPLVGAYIQDAASPEPEGPKTFEAFAMDALREARKKAERSYLPFLDRTSLSCGLYHLAAGSKDGQSPHGQDEVYYVLNGMGQFTVGGETVKVKAGEVLFVAAGEEHRFHDIEQDLDLLVFFSKAPPMTVRDEEPSED